MARSIWSGSISFGLVNIPVKMQMAVRSHAVHFRQLHVADNVPVRYKKVCPADEKELDPNEIVKGYEIAKDQYVIVGEDELEQLQPEKSHTIDISDFVDLPQIDPIYYDKAYYLVPDGKAAKAYYLLHEAMKDSDKVAIAKFVMRNKEYLAAIRPMGELLCLELMNFADEVIRPEEVEDAPAAPKLSDKELDMARQLIDSLAGDFQPEQYHDEYRERVEELIQAKAEGEQIAVPPHVEAEPEVTDLRSALEKSLAEARKSRKKKRA